MYLNEHTEEYISQGINYEMQFENCKLKDDEYCDLTLILSEGGDSETDQLRYRITSDGTKMQFVGDNGQVDQFLIVELTKSNLTMEFVDDDITGTIKLSKQ